MLSDRLHEAIGPMVDFPDDFPPQLIYFNEDKQTFLDEVAMSFDWHTRAVNFFLRKESQDILIHNIYTPNQMLTSRWWMGFADPQSIHYVSPESEQGKQTWSEILSMYKKIDNLIGVALKGLDSNGYFVFSSDHGIAPLNYEVRLNNLFVSRGWLKFESGQSDRAYRIDWAKTKVVFLQSNHIFISTSGLAGPYNPGSGPEYEKLLNEVIGAVTGLQDADGKKPFLNVYTRAEAAEKLGLPPARIGDIVLVHNLGYSAVEDITDTSDLFHKALRSGYKQGLNPAATKCLWTPFMAMGPGIRKGYALKDPISHLDQYPFIFRLLHKETPLPLKNAQILEGLDEKLNEK
jgi:predicted AlkP superfamily phosphohydrolase/phosphomutase